jgi:hypothetical protein
MTIAVPTWMKIVLCAVAVLLASLVYSAGKRYDFERGPSLVSKGFQ